MSLPQSTTPDVKVISDFNDTHYLSRIAHDACTWLETDDCVNNSQFESHQDLSNEIKNTIRHLENPEKIQLIHCLNKEKCQAKQKIKLFVYGTMSINDATFLLHYSSKYGVDEIIEKEIRAYILWKSESSTLLQLPIKRRIGTDIINFNPSLKEALQHKEKENESIPKSKFIPKTNLVKNMLDLEDDSKENTLEIQHYQRISSDIGISLEGLEVNEKYFNENKQIDVFEIFKEQICSSKQLSNFSVPMKEAYLRSVCSKTFNETTPKHMQKQFVKPNEFKEMCETGIDNQLFETFCSQFNNIQDLTNFIQMLSSTLRLDWEIIRQSFDFSTYSTLKDSIQQQLNNVNN